MAGVIDPQRLSLRIGRELLSPNVWNGRHWRVKHRISQEWERDIAYAVLDEFGRHGGGVGLMSALTALSGPRRVTGYIAPKMRVSVRREVPSGRNFIRDDDNLRFCVKPLLDALKRQGYIRNDSRKWIELPTPEQAISTDGGYWTVITIEPVEGEQGIR